MSQQRAAPAPSDPADAEEILPYRAKRDAPGDRVCMSCNKTFPSLGWHNRLCRDCAKRG